MDQGILKVHDLNPDGVRIVVKWETLAPGRSVFVPCVNTHECKQQIKRITKDKNISAEIRTVIEKDMLGVRVWQIV